MTGSRPLVVSTRDADAGDELTSALERHGFDVWRVPAIVIEPAPDSGALDATLADAGIDWIVFTSPRAVEIVCARRSWIDQWPRIRQRARVAAVGPGTAARLRAHDVPVAAVAEGAGDSLPDALRAHGSSIEGLQVLWPRGNRARTGWRDALERLGAHVVSPVAYLTRLAPVAAVAPLVDAVRAGRVAAVTFLSPSSAEGVARACADGTLRELAGAAVVAAIGGTTATRLAELGAPPEVVAPEPTPDALAAALAAFVFDRVRTVRGRGADAPPLRS
ncbi:MAG TPA: uroporphyrinogen-III synthase [Vicinamibacterales bacterium]